MTIAQQIRDYVAHIAAKYGPQVTEEKNHAWIARCFTTVLGKRVTTQQVRLALASRGVGRPRSKDVCPHCGARPSWQRVGTHQKNSSAKPATP